MVTTITIMAITMIADRKESVRVKKASDRLLIYGRRTVGKTFLVKNYVDFEIYIFVKRGGGFYIEGANITTLDSYDHFLEIFRLWIDEGRSIIIDEFQRLPKDFLDYLQFLGDKGRIVLTGSSFHTVRDVLSPSSPILGLFSEMKLSILSPVDILKALMERENPVDSFSLSPYLRDPWTLQYYNDGSTDLVNILQMSKETLRSLIGEVFLEEDKKLSRTYEGIIRGLSLGKWKLGLLSDLLYSRKVLDKPDPHLIRPYFNNMEEMDLVRRLPIFKSKEYKYLVRSPVMELGFFLDERLNFFQQEVSDGRIRAELQNCIPRHIEQFTGELLSEIYDGQYSYFYSRDFDIDFIITRGTKALAVGEVKWKDRVDPEEVNRFIDRTRYFKCDRVFFSKIEVENEEVISLTPENVLNHGG